MKQTITKAGLRRQILAAAGSGIKPPLPVHDETFIKCSCVIADLRNRDGQRSLPLPSALLPPLF
jgi:hypothetical protein